ncbi:MAG: hypothetical protein JNM33_07145 [Rubrivivax sp.]|nr:hypothetical protein [Rubrivivax sp.]
MAKPNYSFEKRQRELAKKNKKEEKDRLKAQRKAGQLPPGEEGAEESDGDAPDTAPAPPAQPGS